MDERKVYLPNGEPRYVRCYDNGGETADRYTVVFTGRRAKANYYPYLGMSAYPFHPQGIGQHGEGKYFVDWPTYGHLGKKIKFSELPEDCQKLVRSDYKAIWGGPT
jgi:hypothetical protein